MERLSAYDVLMFKRNHIGSDDYKILANVVVLDEDDDELYDVNVEVLVDLGPNYHKVSIMWEQDLGDDWKENDPQLYGVYSTDYNNMSYSHKQLEITTSDNRKVVIKV